MGQAHGGEYRDLVVFLAAAGVVVPLFNRLKISPVLGFLAAGVLLGPDGLGRFAQSHGWLSWLTRPSCSPSICCTLAGLSW